MHIAFFKPFYCQYEKALLLLHRMKMQRSSVIGCLVDFHFFRRLHKTSMSCCHLPLKDMKKALGCRYIAIYKIHYEILNFTV